MGDDKKCKWIEISIAMYYVHPTTGVAPCELLMKRTLRTRLDLMRPDIKNEVEKGVRCQQVLLPHVPINLRKEI